MRKKNMVLLIDGENISHRKTEQILRMVHSEGVLSYSKVYRRQKDRFTKGWTEEARKNDIEDIRLCGPSCKNKIDQKIIKDAEKIVCREKNVDIFAIASSDADYRPLVERLRKSGKRVVVIGNKGTSEDLRKKCNMFYELT